MSKFIITSFGYDGGPVFDTKEAARKELAMWKEEDMAACRRKFRMATLKTFGDSYQVTFGANLYSAATIRPI